MVGRLAGGQDALGYRIDRSGQAHKQKEMTNPRELLSSVSDLMTG